MSLDTTPWHVVILLSSILTSIGQIFNKYQVHKATSLQVTLYKYLSSAGLISVIWLITDGVLPKLWWLFILYGMFVYLAVGVTAISTARWYTTKVFALGFVFLVICAAFLTGDYFWAVLTTAIAAAIFKLQLVYDFLTREF